MKNILQFIIGIIPIVLIVIIMHFSMPVLIGLLVLAVIIIGAFVLGGIILDEIDYHKRGHD